MRHKILNFRAYKSFVKFCIFSIILKIGGILTYYLNLLNFRPQINVKNLFLQHVFYKEIPDILMSGNLFLTFRNFLYKLFRKNRGPLFASLQIPFLREEMIVLFLYRLQ